jgi:hypothetical protein
MRTLADQDFARWVAMLQSTRTVMPSWNGVMASANSPDEWVFATVAGLLGTR